MAYKPTSHVDICDGTGEHITSIEEQEKRAAAHAALTNDVYAVVGHVYRGMR
jgi:hypothetical protein